MLPVSPGYQPRASIAMSMAIEAPKSGGRRKRPTVPPEQRKRVKLACEECRRGKVKCDGQKPQCRRCMKIEKQCDYPEVVQTRPTTLQTGDTDGHEKAQLLEAIFSHIHPDILTDVDSLKGLLSAITSEKAISKTSDHDVEARLPSVSTMDYSAEKSDGGSECFVLGGRPMPSASVTVVNQGATHFEGKSSYWSFFTSVKQTVTEGLNAQGAQPEPDYKSTIHHSALTGLGVDRRTAIIAALPPHEVIEFLSGTFFQFAQANYFYIHPDVFYSKLSAFYERTHEFDAQSSLDIRRSNEFICLLFMVLAIGSQFADLTTVTDTNDHSPPLVADLSTVIIPDCTENPGWHFYEVSRQLIADVITSSSMTSVQVCVLQGIFLPSTTSRDAGYSLLGLALRIAINMGMHQSCNTVSLHHYVREMRSRLWWSVYIAERLFSIEMGRPLAINDAEINVPYPTNMPEWNNTTRQGIGNVDGLISTVRICQLLGQIVESVYCKSSSENGTTIRPTVFRHLKRELDNSRKSLPDALKLGSRSERSVAHLALTYEQASILLTRSCLNYTAFERPTSVLSKEAEAFINQQAQECVRAALASIEILYSLHCRSLLNRFSFHDSLYCSAALHVILLAKKQGGRFFSIPKTIIYQGISMLLYLAEGSESASAALKYVIRAFQPYLAKENHIIFSDKQTGDWETKLNNGRKAWESWMAQMNMADPSHSHPIQFNTMKYSNQDVQVSQSSSNHFNSSVAHRKWASPDSRLGQPKWTTTYLENLSTGTIDDYSHEQTDLQPIWIPNIPEIDILSRDLAGIADMSSYKMDE